MEYRQFSCWQQYAAGGQKMYDNKMVPLRQYFSSVYHNTGIRMMAFAATPFILAAVAFQPAANGAIAGPGGFPCPFKTITGLPCPLCGATRSFTFFMHGDSQWLLFNPFWVGVFAAMIIVGAFVAWRVQQQRPVMFTVRQLQIALVLLLGCGWIVSLSNASHIVA